MVQAPATVVTVGLVVAGDLASFGDAARASLGTSLERTLGCHAPWCLLTLRISPASVSVTAILTIPIAVDHRGSVVDDVPTPNSAVVSQSVSAAAATLVAQDVATISSTLGGVVDVLQALPVDVATGVTVPLAVAPPPPPLSPQDDDSSPDEPATHAAGIDVGFIGALVGAVLVLVAACILVRRHCSRSSGKVARSTKPSIVNVVSSTVRPSVVKRPGSRRSFSKIGKEEEHMAELSMAELPPPPPPEEHMAEVSMGELPPPPPPYPGDLEGRGGARN